MWELCRNNRTRHNMLANLSGNYITSPPTYIRSVCSWISQSRAGRSDPKGGGMEVNYCMSCVSLIHWVCVVG